MKCFASHRESNISVTWTTQTNWITRINQPFKQKIIIPIRNMQDYTYQNGYPFFFFKRHFRIRPVLKDLFSVDQYDIVQSSASSLPWLYTISLYFPLPHNRCLHHSCIHLRIKNRTSSMSKALLQRNNRETKTLIFQKWSVLKKQSTFTNGNHPKWKSETRLLYDTTLYVVFTVSYKNV